MAADNQGTVRDLVNNAGAVIRHYRHDVFAELVASRRHKPA